MLQHEGLSPAPPLTLRRTAREPGWPSRTLARVRWFSLDGRLAAGEDPAGSPLLAAQAARLIEPRRRELLAAAVGGLLLAASERPRVSRVPISRGALLRNEAALRELARRVDSRETVYARGLARLELMLGDASSPAFRGSAGALSAEIERVHAELSGVRTDPPAAGAELPMRPGMERRADPPMRPGMERRADPPMRPGMERRADPPISPRRLARLGRGPASQSAGDPPGFAGSSFALPDGSWFHGRREAS